MVELESTKGLQGFVLIMILVAMIIGIGILVLDKFGTTVRDAATTTNESIDLVSGTVTAKHGNVTGFTAVARENQSYTADIGTGINLSTAGVITANGTFENDKYNISYTWKDSSTATQVSGEVLNATRTISDDWLALIVTVMVLSIILTLVISSFAQR